MLAEKSSNLYYGMQRITLLGYPSTFNSKEGVTVRHFETETLYLGEGRELSFLVEGAPSFGDDLEVLIL